MRSAIFTAMSLLVAACSGSKPTASGPPVAVQRTEMRAALSTDGAPAPAATAAQVPAAPSAPVVAQLQFRDHIIVIRAGSGELRYDVQTRAGLLLAGGLTPAELGRQFPALAEQLRDSRAMQMKLDATLHRNAGAGADRRLFPDER